MKGVQEKKSIMGVRCRQKNMSLAITVLHHSANLVMPDSDPRDGFFYLPLTPMKILIIYMNTERGPLLPFFYWCGQFDLFERSYPQPDSLGNNYITYTHSISEH